MSTIARAWAEEKWPNADHLTLGVEEEYERRRQWFIEGAARAFRHLQHPGSSCVGCGHRSDCSLHNEPAMPAGPCDCGHVSRPTVSTEALDELAEEWCTAVPLVGDVVRRNHLPSFLHALGIDVDGETP